jgi:hypothetical protein
MPVQIVNPTPDTPVEADDGLIIVTVKAGPAVLNVSLTCYPLGRTDPLIAGRHLNLIDTGNGFLWVFTVKVPVVSPGSLLFRLSAEWLDDRGRRGTVESGVTLTVAAVEAEPANAPVPLAPPAPGAATSGATDIQRPVADQNITTMKDYLAASGNLASTANLYSAIMYDDSDAKVYPYDSKTIVGVPRRWAAWFTNLTHDGSPYRLVVTDSKGASPSCSGLTVDS